MTASRLLITIAACAALGVPDESLGAQDAKGTPRARDARDPQAPLAGNDLKVRIVLETMPGVYVPLSVPVGTVESVNAVTPQTPPSIIKCPDIAGVALTTGADCFELGLASNTSIKLQVAPMSANGALVPNARFHKWTDIPGSGGLAISNTCTWSAFMPNIKCTMAGNRFIQAVYKCNDTFTYDPVSQQCKKKGGTATLCQKLMPHISICRMTVQVRRGNTGPNAYTVFVAPAALTPSMNNFPSNSQSCRNWPNTGLQTQCAYAFNLMPTSVTLTAASSSGALPPGFFWSGACSGSGATCALSITTNMGAGNNVVANFP